MLTRFSPFLRKKVSKIISPYVKHQFCVYATYMNPEKHITMNHNPNTTLDDIVLMGDYPLPSRYNHREYCQDYMRRAAGIVFEHINAKYLDVKNLDNLLIERWSDLGVDFNKEKHEILNLLATKLFIKEHKLRWPLEQRERLAQTSDIYTPYNLNKKTLWFFLYTYNWQIHTSIERSHLFRSKDIKGDESFLEQYYEDQKTNARSIDSLKKDIPENQTFLNRLMLKLHY